MTITFHHTIKQLAFIMVGTLILSACATSPPAVIDADPNTLRVGVSPDSPPLIYRQNDEITGLEAEMATLLAEHLGKNAVMVEIPWEDQISSLLNNRIDIIMSGMSVTLARQYKIAFSKPYFKSGLMILAKNLQKFSFINNVETVLAQSISWRMGVVKGTTGESFIRQKSIGAKSINAFVSQDEALRALIAGRIDVFIHDAPMLLMMAAEHQADGVKPLPVMLNEEYLAWGLRKDDTELIDSVNTFIERAKAEGTMRTVIKRWIPLAE